MTLDSSFVKDVLKYGIVAVVALIADSGSAFALTHAGVQYLVSFTVGFLIGTVVNFLLSHGYVFKDPVIKSKAMNFTMFAVIGVIGLVGTDIIIWVIHGKLSGSLVAAKLIAVIVVFFWNFLARRQFLYGGHKVEVGKEISFEG